MIVVLTRVSLAILLTTCLIAVGVSQDDAGQQDRPIFVKVTKNREITGAPIDFADIKVTTSFGDVTIPLEKIDAIKLHVDRNDSAVIAFKNGDLVTGKISLAVIKIKTGWGTAHVKTAQIDTVSMVRNARFFTDSSGGAWRFSNTTPSSAHPDRMTTLPSGRRN